MNYLKNVRAPAQTGEVLRMKVSYSEDVASHTGSESCVVVGNCGGEALTGGDAGQVLSREKSVIWGADDVDVSGRQHRIDRYRKIDENPTRSKTLSMHPSTSYGSREIPHLIGSGIPVRIGNALSENSSVLEFSDGVDEHGFASAVNKR